VQLRARLLLAVGCAPARFFVYRAASTHRDHHAVYMGFPRAFYIKVGMASFVVSTFCLAACCAAVFALGCSLDTTQLKTRQRNRSPHPHTYTQQTNAQLGGLMELFMINTGFYSIVTKTEAERWEETREEREERARQFRASVVEQYKKRGLQPPSVLVKEQQRP